jgi:hypothetical protein
LRENTSITSDCIPSQALSASHASSENDPAAIDSQYYVNREEEPLVVAPVDITVHPASFAAEQASNVESPESPRADPEPEQVVPLEPRIFVPPVVVKKKTRRKSARGKSHFGARRRNNKRKAVAVDVPVVISKEDALIDDSQEEEAIPTVTDESPALQDALCEVEPEDVIDEEAGEKEDLEKSSEDVTDDNQAQTTGGDSERFENDDSQDQATVDDPERVEIDDEQAQPTLGDTGSVEIVDSQAPTDDGDSEFVENDDNQAPTTGGDSDRVADVEPFGEIEEDETPETVVEEPPSVAAVFLGKKRRPRKHDPYRTRRRKRTPKRQSSFSGSGSSTPQSSSNSGSVEEDVNSSDVAAIVTQETGQDVEDVEKEPRTVGLEVTEEKEEAGLEDVVEAPVVEEAVMGNEIEEEAGLADLAPELDVQPVKTKRGRGRPPKTRNNRNRGGVRGRTPVRSSSIFSPGNSPRGAGSGLDNSIESVDGPNDVPSGQHLVNGDVDVVHVLANDLANRGVGRRRSSSRIAEKDDLLRLRRDSGHSSASKQCSVEDTDASSAVESAVAPVNQSEVRDSSLVTYFYFSNKFTNSEL